MIYNSSIYQMKLQSKEKKKEQKIVTGVDDDEYSFFSSHLHSSSLSLKSEMSLSSCDSFVHTFLHFITDPFSSSNLPLYFPLMSLSLLSPSICTFCVMVQIVSEMMCSEKSATFTMESNWIGTKKNRGMLGLRKNLCSFFQFFPLLVFVSISNKRIVKGAVFSTSMIS